MLREVENVVVVERLVLKVVVVERDVLVVVFAT